MSVYVFMFMFKTVLLKEGIKIETSSDLVYQHFALWTGNNFSLRHHIRWFTILPGTCFKVEIYNISKFGYLVKRVNSGFDLI